MISNKQDFLKFIKGAGVGLYGGSPAQGSTVKFQFSTNLGVAASSTTAGALTFAADASGNAAIFASDGTAPGKLVSSKIQDITTAVTGANGGKTVTVSYVRMDEGHYGDIGTTTFDVIDETALESYFNNSSTLEYVAGTSGADKFEVKLKANGGLAVDEDGIYTVLDNIFAVDGKTIAFKNDNKTIETKVKIGYVAANPATEQKAAIQLQDVDGGKLSEVTVEQLIGSGIVSSTSYDPTTNILTINWVGGAKTEINLSTIIDISDYVNLDPDYLTITADTSVLKFGVTDKTKNAVALAETALQGINKTATSKTYVDLTVGTKTTDTSTQSLEIVETGLVSKFTEVDGSIGDISTRLSNKTTEIDASITALKAKDVEIDGSLGRLNSSVNALEDAIIALDATESDNVLDGSIAITVTQADGLITGVDLKATKSTVAYTTKDGETPANLTGTAGLLTGGDIATIKQYIDDTQASGFDSLDSNIDIDSADGSLNFKVTEADGLLTTGEISYTKSTVAFTAAQGSTPSNLTGTPGFVTGGDIAAIKSYVDSVSARLDSSVSDKDTKEFVEVKTEMTDGALSAQEVNVTYGAFTVAPGSVTASTQGIADSSSVAAAINDAIKWIVL